MHAKRRDNAFINYLLPKSGADPETLKGGAQSIVDTSQFVQWFFKPHMVKQIK